MAIQRKASEAMTTDQTNTITKFHQSSIQNFDALKKMVELITPTLISHVNTTKEEQRLSNEEKLKEMTQVMTETKETKVRIFQMVMKLQNDLPAQINRQQPIHFIDACGFHAPFHLEFINSLDAFEAVLKVRFEDKGLRKILRREYALERGGKKMVISQKMRWDRCILPGTTLYMDMLFKVPYETINSCPTCNVETTNSTKQEIDW